MTEDTPTDSGKSEWNEQEAFSRLFFEITNSCRYWQSRVDVIAWKTAFESKISLVMGVSNLEERTKLKEIRDTIKSAGDISQNKKKRALMFDYLFDAEAEVDLIAHRHMPFLKLKRDTDIGGM